VVQPFVDVKMDITISPVRAQSKDVQPEERSRLPKTVSKDQDLNLDLDLDQLISPIGSLLISLK